MNLMERIAYLARKGDAAAIDELLMLNLSDAIIRGRVRADREAGRYPPPTPLARDPLEALRQAGQGYVHQPGRPYEKSRR